MFKLPAAALLSLSVLMHAGCTGGTAPTEGEPIAADAVDDFDSVNTPPAVKSDTLDDSIANNPPAAASRATMPQEQATSNPETPASAESDTVPDRAASSLSDNDSNPGIEIVPKTVDEELIVRESLVGRWEFLLCEFGRDLVGLLLEVTGGDDGLDVRVVEDSQLMSGWSVASAMISERSAEIQFARDDGGLVDFAGTLDEDGIVRGNVIFGETGLNVVRLLPTKRSTLDPERRMLPSVNVELMEGFQPDPENPLADLRAKARELGQSALGYQLFSRLTAVFRGQKPEEAAFAGFDDDYLNAARPWGPRVVARAKLDLGRTMATCGYSPNKALEYLEQAEAAIPEDSPLLSLIKTPKALIFLRSDEEIQQQAGIELANEIRAAEPFESEVTLELAGYHERQDQLEQALALHLELAALPTGSGDMDSVKRLWSELGRDPEAVEEQLNAVYKSRVHEFADKSSDAPRAERAPQTVLGELFTGGSCPPCVSADVATGGLEITYPKADFIMLRYHQHVPGPDPLATADGEARAGAYYRIQGTPSLYFNGQAVETVGSIYGSIADAANGYADLRNVLDPLLLESSEVSIELATTADGGEIQIAARVNGAEQIPEAWRLRLCLAEDEIAYAARNGVRLHEMVVRAMPGTAEGIAPENGKLEFNGTVSLAEVRDGITEYVSQIPGLPEPPLELTRLHVVAFVQDDRTREVLQAVAAPVEVPATAAPESSPQKPETEESDAVDSQTEESRPDADQPTSEKDE